MSSLSVGSTLRVPNSSHRNSNPRNHLERVPEEDTQKYTHTQKEDESIRNAAKSSSNRGSFSTHARRWHRNPLEEEQQAMLDLMENGFKQPEEQIYNLDKPLKGWLRKKSYLDFQTKKDFALLRDPQFFKWQRWLAKRLLSYRWIALTMIFTALYLVFKFAMLISVTPLLVKGSLEKFKPAVKLFRTDFMFTLIFMLAEQIPHAFAFRKYYVKRTPFVQRGLILTLAQFVLCTMILYELYDHYPLPVFSDTYSGPLLLAAADNTSPSSVVFTNYLGAERAELDYRSVTLSLYLIISCYLQSIKCEEFMLRLLRIKGLRVFGTNTTRHGSLESDKLSGSRELSHTTDNTQLYDTLRRMLQKTIRRLQGQPEVSKDLDLCLYLLERANQSPKQRGMHNSSIVSEDVVLGTRNDPEQPPSTQRVQRNSTMRPSISRIPQKRDSSSLRQPSSSLMQQDLNGSFVGGSVTGESPPAKIRRSGFNFVSEGSTNLQFEITLNPGKHASYLTTYNQAIKNCLMHIDSINFNIFELQRVSSGREFLILGYEIAMQNFLLEKCGVDRYTYINFLDGLARSYNEITIAPYHCRTHAADVLQALHVFMKEGGLQQLLQLSPIEHLGAIVAAMAHDTDHPGLNNGFLVNSKDEMALLYNDQSVLENHHVAQTFMLLREEELDILAHFPPPDYRKIREVIIKMVLATDMAVHAASMNMLKSITEKIALPQDPSRAANGFSNNQFINIEEELRTVNKLFLMGQTLHFSDITNPCREWAVCSRWTDLLFREFFAQGDLERSSGLPISFLMDKRTTNIADSQVTFINFIIEPSFSEFGKLCRGVLSEVRPGGAKSLFHNMRENQRTWESLKSVFEQYREMSAILDPELHLDSTLDIGSMRLSLSDEFFSYENYLARKRKRQQISAPGSPVNRKKSSHSRRKESNSQVAVVINEGHQENLSPQVNRQKLNAPKSLSSQAVGSVVVDPASNSQLLIPTKARDEVPPGTQRTSTPRRHKKLTKEINDSTLRTESDGTAMMHLSGAALSGSGAFKHINMPQLSQNSIAVESKKGELSPAKK